LEIVRTSVPLQVARIGKFSADARVYSMCALLKRATEEPFVLLVK
jgi:hypothetical protein